MVAIPSQRVSIPTGGILNRHAISDSRNTLSAGFDSDSRPNWACCDARFQTRFPASPHFHPKRGVTKIGHHALKIKFEIRNPKQIQNSNNKCPKHHSLSLFRYMVPKIFVSSVDSLIKSFRSLSKSLSQSIRFSQ